MNQKELARVTTPGPTNESASSELFRIHNIVADGFSQEDRDRFSTSDFSPYKDLYAKVAPQKACGKFAVLSECSTGDHRFAKALYCGREWCSVCGADGSPVHKRRQARTLTKMTKVEIMGYLVIEFPEFYRHIGKRGMDPDLDGGQFISGWCYSKQDLQETTDLILEVIQGRRHGRKGRINGYFSRGTGRWHWHGKEPGKYNPHYNILFDFNSLTDERREASEAKLQLYEKELKAQKQSKKTRRELRGIELFKAKKTGYMPRLLLQELQADLRTALGIPELIIHYSYCQTPGQKVHKVRYVTRSTFLKEYWDPYMARELWRFRNTRHFGLWPKDEPNVWELTQAEEEGEDVAGLSTIQALRKGYCPDCGSELKVLRYNEKGDPIHWTAPFDCRLLEPWGAEEIQGTGYYRVPALGRNGTVLTPDELLRLEELAVARMRNRSPQPFAELTRKPPDELRKLTDTHKRMLRRIKRMEDRHKAFNDTDL